jgi:cytidylate kinase
VAERDAAALDYVRRYYDNDAAAALHYDLVLNTHTLPPAAAAELIVAALACLPAGAAPTAQEAIR